LTLYGTNIHALKSAAAGIGADALSGRASALEELARHGNLDAVTSHNAEFLQVLESLLQKIEKAVAAYDMNAEGKSPSGAEPLTSVLIRLKAALEEMDAGAINTMADELQKSAYAENAAAVRTIYGRILMAEYEDAEALIDELLRKEG
jgi:HPt (histidine-containing phosphotransfer) domain-containing protein